MKSFGIVLLLLIIIMGGCIRPSCTDILPSYSTYDSALTAIKQSSFDLEEEADVSNSEWIDGAYFYSCNMSTGYFVIVIDSKQYLYNDVPINIWEGFKEAKSCGSYYDHHIKGRYQYHLKRY